MSDDNQEKFGVCFAAVMFVLTCLLAAAAYLLF